MLCGRLLRPMDRYDLKTFQIKAKPTKKVEGLKPGMSLILKK